MNPSEPESDGITITDDYLNVLTWTMANSLDLMRSDPFQFFFLSAKRRHVRVRRLVGTPKPASMVPQDALALRLSKRESHLTKEWAQTPGRITSFSSSWYGP